MTTSKGKLISPKKAAEKYGLDRTMIYYWLRYKRVDFVKLEKTILIWEESLVQFLEAHTVAASEE